MIDTKDYSVLDVRIETLFAFYDSDEDLSVEIILTFQKQFL